MADTPIDERRFTDQEVHEILKKAVEKAPSRALVKSEGLSLAELKAIGGEVGIDAARLEDAARTVALGGGSRSNPILRTIFKKVSGSESAKLQQVVDELARLTEGSGD